MYAIGPSESSRGGTNLSASVAYVIDDEESIRNSVAGLLRSVGLTVEVFASSRDFLACPKQGAPSCLILDVRLRGESGLEFQKVMERHGLRMPVVFITGYGDIEMTVKAMKAGATDFLTKPYREQDLLDAVAHALAKDRERLNSELSVCSLREAYETLTVREREVVGLVLAGLLNKQIAFEMNVTEFTVKMHRSHAMKKIGALSVADLVGKLRSLSIEPSSRSEFRS